MMHPDTKLKWISDEKGIGVVATKIIPKGTITWVQDELDRVFAPEEPESYKPMAREMLEKYSFRNRKGEHVLCWDIAKYVNHSFKSNCLSTAYNFEVAIRDIQIDEELTDDYGYLNLTESFVPEDEGTERKKVNPDDTLKLYREWDAILEPLFSELEKLDQPLYELLSDKLKKEIRKISNSEVQMLSTKTLYFKPEKSRI
ncbi:SET domain-containing protein [Christiangramia sp. SM2212]|uniref:SET domain-containing protein n=1 Tax=Christiangramia sediminicola TaxID=3073267 RepID=A0ABU1ELC6_9FLAO|nr:SET domain-containing protein [Christiangramia sp. SM2212]MDR5589161.1 SET domain-containing protein [Christiangramia sp. SM2212]